MDHRTGKTDFLKGAVLCAVSGLGGFSGDVTALPLALLFAAGLSFATTWRHGFTLAFIYYLCAAHGLFLGIYDFTSGDALIAVVGPLLTMTALALPFVLVAPFRSLGLLVALALVTVPPLGHIGWANPITASGLYFPGFGFMGLGLFVLVFLLVFHKPLLGWLAPLAIVVWLLMPMPESDPTETPWLGLDTQLGDSITADGDLFSDFRAATKLRALVRRTPHDQVLLPEGAAGVWTDTARRLWVDSLKTESQVVLVGGESPAPNDQLYNSLIMISHDAATPVYHARMPVPYFMARSSSGYFATADNNGVFTMGDTVYGGLICYEAYLFWTVLQTHVHRPNAVFVIGNYWWAKRTNLMGIVRANTQAWSLLFGVPYYTSFNT